MGQCENLELDRMKRHYGLMVTAVYSTQVNEIFHCTTVNKSLLLKCSLMWCKCDREFQFVPLKDIDGVEFQFPSEDDSGIRPSSIICLKASCCVSLDALRRSSKSFLQYICPKFLLLAGWGPVSHTWQNPIVLLFLSKCLSKSSLQTYALFLCMWSKHYCTTGFIFALL